MGMDGFIWWFGIVENRADPDFLGRCQVRIYGYHNADPVQVPTKDLPWSHPITPLGQNTPSSPAEGSLIFGFFADGKQAKFPIMLGTVPFIADTLPEEGLGFRDPFTSAIKNSRPFPRKITTSKINSNATPPSIVEANVKTNPGVTLNEPTTSRLARPDRIESPDTGESLGVRSNSIEGTSIDFQRKNRIKYVKTAKVDEPLPSELNSAASKGRRQVVWNEPCPSYNAKFPFNHVRETESGHSFEMDDTKDYERVQLSHRTGSTLEFLPSGSIKEKSFNHKYDIVMGNHKEYIAGDKLETIQGGCFLRINGKLVIQADSIDIEAQDDVNIRGKNIKLTADNKMDLFSVGGTKVYGAAGVDLRSEGVCATYGGKGAVHSSGGLTTISGTVNPIAEAVREILKGLIPKSELDEISKRKSLLESGVLIQGPNMFLNCVSGFYNTALTQFVPLVMPPTKPDDGADVAGKFRAPVPQFKQTKSSNTREDTDGMCAFEQEFIGTKDIPDSIKATALTEDKLQNAANNSAIDILKADIPQFTSG